MPSTPPVFGILSQSPSEAHLLLPIPPSANHYWKLGRGRIYLTDEALQYKSDLLKLLGQLDPLEGHIGFSFTVYRARQSGDLDNFSKVLQDSLQGLLYKNDSQVVETHHFREDDKSNPRVHVRAWVKNSRRWIALRYFFHDFWINDHT